MRATVTKTVHFELNIGIPWIIWSQVFMVDSLPEHSSPPSQDPVAEMEALVSLLFSELADLFGNPRSFGAIFGLLFASKSPLTMDEVARRLSISTGSASQGLRQLEEFGAITHTRDPQTRANRYTARTEMKPLIHGFLKQRVAPRMEQAERQIQQIAELAARVPPSHSAHTHLRVVRLKKWHSRAKTLYPIATKLLGEG